jgi:hypothetical protein
LNTTIQSKLIYAPLFSAAVSIACLAIYYAAREFSFVRRVVGRHLDVFGGMGFVFALIGAVLGLCILQRHTKNRIVMFGASLSAFALLLNIFLPL